MQFSKLKYRPEVYRMTLIIVARFIFFVINKNETNLLNKKGVYVIGKLFSSTSEGEISWVYDFQFRFNNKTFHRNFTGPLSNKIKKDSLMFFKILPQDPSVCRQLEGLEVPSCVLYDSVPTLGWPILPLNVCK